MDFWTLQAVEGWILLNNLTEAELELNKLSNKNSFEYWVFLFTIRTGQNKHKEALFSIERAIKLRPDLDALWINMANSVRKIDGEKASILVLDKAIKQFPNSDIVWYNQAAFHSFLGLHEAAETYLKEAFKINPYLKQIVLYDPDFKGAVWVEKLLENGKILPVPQTGE
jgi:predicted Zn-dependent protease